MPLENLKREHRRHERALARVLDGFFTGQQRRVLSALRDFRTITTSIIDQVFREDNEHEKLMKAVRVPLATIMGQSALAEYRRTKPCKRRTSKADATLTAGIFDPEIVC